MNAVSAAARGWTLFTMLGLVACGDDGAADGDDDDGSTGPSSGDATIDDSDDGESSDDDTSGGDSSDGTVDDTTGGPSPNDCTPTTLPGELADATWDDRLTVPGLTGRDGYLPTAWDLAVDDDGAMLVAGYFRWADGERHESLARREDDAWWTQPGWHALPGSGITAIAVGPAGELAAASNDLAMHGDGEILVDTGSGPTVIGQHAGAFRRLAWIDGALWGVGRVSVEGGIAGIAIWDGDGWSGAPGGDPDADVFEILPDGEGGVVVAGEFTEIGGIAADKVARFTGSAWEPLDMPEAARVLALEIDDEGTLWAGGLFTLAPQNLPAASLARWTGSEWELAGGGVAAGEATGVVSDLQWVDGAMIVAGCFDVVGGATGDPNAIDAAGLAVLDGASWAALASDDEYVGMPWFDDLVCGFEPDPAAVFAMTLQRIHHDGARLWVAGGFGGIDGVPSQSVAVHDDEGWHPVGDLGLGVSGTIDQLGSGGSACDVLALASATHAGGDPLTSRVVRWDDGRGWTSAAPALPAGQQCTELEVDADGSPWIGCSSFDPMVDGEVFRLVDDGWISIGDLPGPVNDLALADDGALWIVGGDGTGYLARAVDGELEIVEDGFDVVALAVDTAPRSDEPGDYDVVVAGPFGNVGDVAANRIARWDGETWAALGDGLSATPSALEATADHVWVGTFDEGTPDRLVLGRWDGSAWVDVGTPEHGLPAPMGESSHTFTRLVAVEGGLLAVGYVWPSIGGRNAFFFDGEQFTPIQGGIAAISVDDVLPTADSLFFAGSIAEVGEGEALRPSVGMARLRWR